MGEADMPNMVHYNRDRRRSSFTRPMRDPEEILEGLRSLKAAKRELGRTMSLSGDKRRDSREYGYVASLLASSFRLTIRSFVRSPVKLVHSPVQLFACLSVCLSVFHALVDFFLYSSVCFSSFSLSLTLSHTFTFFVSVSLFLPLSLLFSHHHRSLSLSLSRSLDPSIGSIHPRSTSRSNLPRRPAPCVSYTHANKCMCARTYMYPCMKGAR